MTLPTKFTQLHADALFKLYMLHGQPPVVSITPHEPLGGVDLDGPTIDAAVTIVTVRCINDRGTVRFEAASPADSAAAHAWAVRHERTTKEEFDWLPRLL